jgi:hypothetical protein
MAYAAFSAGLMSFLLRIQRAAERVQARVMPSKKRTDASQLQRSDHSFSSASTVKADQICGAQRAIMFPSAAENWRGRNRHTRASKHAHPACAPSADDLPDAGIEPNIEAGDLACLQHNRRGNVLPVEGRRRRNQNYAVGSGPQLRRIPTIRIGPHGRDLLAGWRRYLDHGPGNRRGVGNSRPHDRCQRTSTHAPLKPA